MIYVNENSKYIQNDVEGFKTAVQSLHDHDLSFVNKRLIEQHNWIDESAERARLNFVRFASLTFACNEKLVPSIEVDEFWHSFLLFTQDYKNWCELHWNSSFFFHHAPGHQDGGSWDKTVLLVQDIFNEDWNPKFIAMSCYTPPPQEPSRCWKECTNGAENDRLIVSHRRTIISNAE